MVLCGVVDVEQDTESGHGYQHRDDGEQEAMAEFIREVCDEHGETERGGPGWNGVELGFDRWKYISDCTVIEYCEGKNIQL